MQIFTVAFSRTSVTVLILITVPLLVAAVFITPLLYFPQSPDWLLMLSSILILVVGVISVKYSIRKWGVVKAELAMDDRGITIRLLQRSPFYPRKEYGSAWDGLENVSENIEAERGTRFYLITFRQPAATITLTPAEKTDAGSATPFGAALLKYVSHYNVTQKSRPQSLVRQRGFYESWWAKGITISVYLTMAIVLIMYFTVPEKVSNWRLIQAVSVGLMWQGLYSANRRKRNS